MKKLTQKILSKKELIKQTALELFLNKGYEETSLSDIIKITGGSYSNIYDLFDNKENLLFEILDDLCKEHTRTIFKQIQGLNYKNLQEFLLAFGYSYVEFFNKPQTIAFGKIIYAQVYTKDKNKRLIKWFKDNQEFFSHSLLVLEFKKFQNDFLASNALKLAEIFCSMLKEPYHNSAVLFNQKVFNKNEQKQHVEFVVNLFLNGIKK